MRRPDHPAQLADRHSIEVLWASNELRRDHAFELIPRFNADQGIYRSMALPSDLLGV